LATGPKLDPTGSRAACFFCGGQATGSSLLRRAFSPENDIGVNPLEFGHFSSPNHDWDWSLGKFRPIRSRRLLG
jgi:hypothetical protein